MPFVERSIFTLNVMNPDDSRHLIESPIALGQLIQPLLSHFISLPLASLLRMASLLVKSSFPSEFWGKTSVK